MKNQTRATDKKVFFLLWILCIIGSWSVLPYVRYSEIVPSSVSILKLFMVTTLQAAISFGVVCWLSFKILPKTDLHPFRVKNILKQVIYPAVLVGGLVGLTLYIFDQTVFHSSVLGAHPPLWAGLLGSLYGAVNEEVLLRLFLFSGIYFLLSKVLKLNRESILWTTNILVAILFGLGHLPAAYKLTTPTAYEISRILILNGIAGIAFGWLYWSRGLWAAIGAHFVADLVIHVFLI